jgi:hypothetical protein
VQVVKHNLLKLLVNLFLLPQDDIPLSLNRRLVQFGVLQDVAEDVNSLGNILVETFRVVYGLLPGCVGIEVGSNILDFKLEVGLLSGFSTLEGKVL